MRVGIYGGSFDPPTKAHLNVITRALEYCDKLYLMVTQNNYLKKNQTDFNHRWEMTKLLFDKASEERIVLGVGAEYTMVTAEQIIQKEKCQKVLLIFGSDLIEQMPRWRGFETLTESPKFDILFLSRHEDISSTLIRNFISRRTSENTGTYTLTKKDYLTLEDWTIESVIDYMVKNKLYGGKL